MSARWPALASALRRVALLAVGVLVWELVARSGMFSPIIVPSVTRIGYQFWLLAIQPESLVEVWYSVFRGLSGFALAAVVGSVPLLAIARIRPAAAVAAAPVAEAGGK